jgi:hypothetical protein
MHYLAALATFKNEAMILKEWIEHYKWQEFDHIFLINNNSDDDYMSVLRPYIKEGYVTLFDLPGKYQQINNYNIAFLCIQNSITWLAVCDIDEYWFTPTGTVKKYIEALDNNNIHVLYTRWYGYGSSGHDTQPSSIRTSFTKRAEDVGSVKSIVRASNVIQLDIHQHSLTDDTIVKIDYDNIRLNHYRVMSREYFMKTKLVRGSPSGYPSLDICDIYRDEKYFVENDTNDIEDNTLANLVLNNASNISAATQVKPLKRQSSIDTLKQFLKEAK